MKKFISFILIFVLATILVGCSKPSPEPDPDIKEPTKYTVEFLVDNVVIKTEEVEEGKAAQAPADPAKEGFEFKGWDKEFTNVKNDLKINAKFEKIIIYYTVTFLVDGKAYDTQTVEEGKAATQPADPTKEGFEFKGWDKEFANITSDLEVNALFEEARVYYTVEFLVDGKVYATQQVEHGKAAELPEQPTLEGKYFAGWLKDTSNVTENMKVRSRFVEVDLEQKEVKGFPLQIGKAPITRFIYSGKGYDSESSAIYNEKIYLIPGAGSGNVWWYRIFIKNEGGQNRVIEVAARGASQKTEVCDYTILCYPDKLASVLSSTGVQVGDIITFTKDPTSFTETTDCNESFSVKRPTDMKAYNLNSDTAHTVVALHKMDLYFKSLGEKVSVEKLELTTLDNETDATIEWTSSNPEVIDALGNVKLPDAATEVTLTATAKYESSTYIQKFTLTVGK